MFRVLAIMILLALACPITSTMAQDGMLRALANRWKTQQDQQRRIQKDLNKLEQDAAKSFRAEPSDISTAVKSGKWQRKP